MQEICTFGIEMDSLKDHPVPNPYFETALPNQFNNTYPCPPRNLDLGLSPDPGLRPKPKTQRDQDSEFNSIRYINLIHIYIILYGICIYI